jgi:hypothetical protein
VTQILAGAKVTFTVMYTGMRDPSFVGSEKHNVMDAWRVTLTKTTIGPTFTTEYFTGVGLRESPKTSMRNDLRPVTPLPGSVLYCLCSDASGVEDQTFAEWADNFGYSSDSIKKARDIYFACQETGAQLRRLFGRETFDKLAEAVREY